MRIFFRAEALKMLYARNDYELLQYLGDLGGIIDFVLLLGMATSHIFVKRLFQAALVNRVYRL